MFDRRGVFTWNQDQPDMNHVMGLRQKVMNQFMIIIPNGIKLIYDQPNYELKGLFTQRLSLAGDFPSMLICPNDIFVIGPYRPTESGHWSIVSCRAQAQPRVPIRVRLVEFQALKTLRLPAVTHSDLTSYTYSFSSGRAVELQIETLTNIKI